MSYPITLIDVTVRKWPNKQIDCRWPTNIVLRPSTSIHAVGDEWQFPEHFLIAFVCVLCAMSMCIAHIYNTHTQPKDILHYYIILIVC